MAAMKFLALRKTERSMADGLNLVVHSFQGAVAQPQLGPGEKAVQMRAQHAHEGGAVANA
jgi:hypothetical protein